MKTVTRLLLCAALLATAMLARAERTYNQAELDALLAPIALYPDSVLSNILVAASYPDDVREAAAWSRANPQLRGDDALRMVENLPWHPSVKALVAMPEVLARMDESPAWLHDLGEADRVHGPYVMETVQSLRRRAQASGNLRSDSEQQVYYEGSNIVVAPLYPNFVYVRYYDPFVVYGAWWWAAYRPIVWRPFAPRVVVINRPVYVNRPAYVHRPVYVQRPVQVQQPVVVHRPPADHRPVVVRPPVTRTQFRPGPEPRRDNGGPSPAERVQRDYQRDREKARAPQQGSNRDPEQHRQTIAQPPNQPQGKFAAAGGQSQQRSHGGGRHRD
jgi:hypothetical protein